MKITILHLSDIQYGRHHVDDTGGRPPLYSSNDYNIELQKLVSDLSILRKSGVKPNFLIVTGDITETSIHEEYTLAEKFFNGIVNFLGIDKRNVAMVPGNHDINRNLCQAARLRAQALGEDFSPPYFEKFEIYSVFFHRFYEDIKWKKDETNYTFSKDKLYVPFVFPKQKLIIIGLNSCIDESEMTPHYGNITIEQCNKAFKEVNSIDKKKTFRRIVIMHHNFIRSSNYDEENLKDADELMPLFLKNKVGLILHGHQHITKDQLVGKGELSIPVLPTGSAGLDSTTIPGNCRRYQVIELDENTVKVYRRRFDNNQVYLDGKGCWVPDISPDATKIYSEFQLNPESAQGAIKQTTEKVNYDIYKIDPSLSTLKGKDILMLAYPRREIEVIDRVLDHKNRIYYEYLFINVDLSVNIYFLFVGKNINITATVKHFIQNHELPQLGITICTPRVKSKLTGEKRFRTKNVEDVFNQIIKKQVRTNKYRLDVVFIDDYVWKNCLDLSFRKSKFLVSESPYYIDQNLFQIQGHDNKWEETNLGLSLSYFSDLFRPDYESDNVSNPISVILGSGGMGKTTLCDKLVNTINNYDKKKAIYINAQDLISNLNLENITTDVRTIGDLFKLYDTLTGSKHTSLHDPNNLEINISCGNIVAIIDGLDEIESALIDRFNIDDFLNSIININQYFNNCTLILTSRDYHKEKYLDRDGLNIYYLKGFDQQHVEAYFKKRCNNDPLLVKRCLEYVKKLNIKTEDHYMPLFMTLISDIVERGGGDISFQKKEYFDVNFLRPQYILDDLIVRLIDREIDKQKLGITIDQFTELLVEIAVINKGNIDLKSLHEYIDICLPSGDSDLLGDEQYIKYHINPLLVVTDKSVHIKYDVLTNLLKVRYLQDSIIKIDFSKDIIPVLAEDPYGRGIVLDELTHLDNVNLFSLNDIKALLKFLINEYNSTECRQDRELIQRSISFAIHLAFRIINPADKEDRTNLLKRLYNNDLRNIFIYGEFYPMDFTGLKVMNSIFVGYTNLFMSTFPKDETVFYYCSFLDMPSATKNNVAQIVFDDSCNMPIELRSSILKREENKVKYFALLKNDLKKFFKSFVTSNVFAECSLNNMNSTFITRFSRKIFIDEMMGNDILSFRVKKGTKLYSINEDFRASVSTLIYQNNLDPSLEKFCEYLMGKYYKI